MKEQNTLPIKRSTEKTTGLISVAVARRGRITYSFVISFSTAERERERRRGNKSERKEQKKVEEIGKDGKK